MGLNPTIAGLATISAEAEPARFQSVFGVEAPEVAPRRPGQADSGNSGADASPNLTVPAPLMRYVQNISVAPPHIDLRD
jgi:hypothetical protein